MTNPLSIPPRRPRGSRCTALTLAVLLPLAGCGRQDEEHPAPPAPELSASIEIPDPEPRLVQLSLVEDESEDVANRFVDLSEKLRRREFEAARDWFAEDFAGHGLWELAEASRESLHLGAERRVFDPGSAPILDRQGFVDSLQAWLGPWQRVELVQWKVKGAEFSARAPRWGKIRFRLSLQGDGPGGEPQQVVAWGHGRVERRAGQWLLTAFDLESLSADQRHAPLFTEVATSSGLAFLGLRFGQPGNDSYAFGGAAGGDADGDGLWDLFVANRQHNFLYLAQRDGSFAERAGRAGLEQPAGGTGALWLDFDNDGDQDLALADVGWRDTSGAVGGNPLRLLVNDGRARFGRRGAALGFADLCDGYSLTALDADNDGWLDLFVSCYGRIEADPNDSWIEARNGSSNRLYRNRGGRRFEELAGELGIRGHGWSYASAAADYDADGDTDLYVANDYGSNRLWRNDTAPAAEGRAARLAFVDAAPGLDLSDPGNGMAVTWGDLDGDERVDLYVANMASTAGSRILGRMGGDADTVGVLRKMAAGNSIFVQTADGGFRRQGAERGGIGGSWAWSTVLVDLDLDACTDIFCTNGFVTGDTPWDT